MYPSDVPPSVALDGRRRIRPQAFRARLWKKVDRTRGTISASSCFTWISLSLRIRLRARVRALFEEIRDMSKFPNTGYKHGHRGGKKSPEYSSWSSARNRCHNPKDKAWKYYGERGVAMCEEWRNDFRSFLAYIGLRPAGTTLDRYPDADGNYQPGNVRWATSSQQQNNRRKPSNQISILGTRITVVDASKKYRVSQQLIRQRITAGWLPERAVGIQNSNASFPLFHY